MASSNENPTRRIIPPTDYKTHTPESLNTIPEYGDDFSPVNDANIVNFNLVIRFLLTHGESLGLGSPVGGDFTLDPNNLVNTAFINRSEETARELGIIQEYREFVNLLNEFYYVLYLYWTQADGTRVKTKVSSLRYHVRQYTNEDGTHCYELVDEEDDWIFGFTENPLVKDDDFHIIMEPNDEYHLKLITDHDDVPTVEMYYTHYCFTNSKWFWDCDEEDSESYEINIYKRENVHMSAEWKAFLADAVVIATGDDLY